MFVIDKRVASDLAKELRRLAEAGGVRIGHAQALDAASAALGFGDVNAMSALLAERPIFVNVVSEEGAPRSPFPSPASATEQVVRLVRHARPYLPWLKEASEGGEGGTPASILSFAADGGVLAREPVRVGGDWRDAARRGGVLAPGAQGADGLYMCPDRPDDVVPFLAAACVPGGTRWTSTGDMGDARWRYRLDWMREPTLADGIASFDLDIDVTYMGYAAMEREPSVPFDVTLGLSERLESLEHRRRRRIASDLGGALRWWTDAFMATVASPSPRPSDADRACRDLAARLASPDWLREDWDFLAVSPGGEWTAPHLDRVLLAEILGNACLTGVLAFRAHGREVSAGLPGTASARAFSVGQEGGIRFMGRLAAEPPEVPKSSVRRIPATGLRCDLCAVTGVALYRTWQDTGTDGRNLCRVCLNAATTRFGRLPPAMDPASRFNPPALIGRSAAGLDDAAIPAYVRALAVTGDGECRARFDAVPWLRRANPAHVAKLAWEHWRGEVAMHAAWQVQGDSGFEGVTDALDYADANGQGLDVFVHGPDAMSWLAAYRPDVHGMLMERERGLGATDEDVVRCNSARIPFWDMGKHGVRYAREAEAAKGEWVDAGLAG
jgi:hypothetical protein